MSSGKTFNRFSFIYILQGKNKINNLKINRTFLFHNMFSQIMLILRLPLTAIKNVFHILTVIRYINSLLGNTNEIKIR